VILPCVLDIPAVEYHADPLAGMGGSMSSTTARHILAPGCPALVQWESSHPVHKDVYDVGTVAHRLTLGAGAEIVEVQADDWRSKAAKDARATARDGGRVALLTAALRECEDMAIAVHADRFAGALLAPGTGVPERSVFWADPVAGVNRRAMFDWLPDGPGRPIGVDLKTTPSAAPKHIRKSIVDYGYHQQAAWYLDGMRAVGFEDPAFLFVFVEKTPPYLVTVVELDDAALREGDYRNAQAMEDWAECKATGEWPGYTNDIVLIGLPQWAITDTERY
jgi:hypothetical protein